jgi:hypothetical protein
MAVKLKLVIFLSLFCLAINNLDASSSKDEKTALCNYLVPTQPVNDELFFHDLILRANDEMETFDTIASYLKEQAVFCHRFQFKFPLKEGREYAQIFAQVLQIKAQQAHRFVPVISFSQFLTPSHLGFIRKIKIGDRGPNIQEHVLVDRIYDNIIFIEELIEDSSQGIELGCFAALNSILEEEGAWYFTGTYLYNWEPDTETMNDTIQMFKKTYENMASFIENNDVDAIYHQLSEY